MPRSLTLEMEVDQYLSTLHDEIGILEGAKFGLKNIMTVG